MEKIKELTAQRMQLEAELKQEQVCFLFSEHDKIYAYNEKSEKVKALQSEIDELILSL